MDKKHVAGQVLKYIIMTVIAGIVLLPIYYLIVTTFKTSAEAAIYPMALPQHPDISGYVEAFQKMQYPRAFRNTCVITVSAVLLLVVTASMCGYVLNRKSRYKIVNLIFLLFLAGLMFPYQMSILGLYKIVQSLHLMNTHIAVIAIDVAVNLPFAIFLMRSFVSTIPEELEEAAHIDGASVFRAFWTIIFPLMKPTIGTVVILNTLGIWNDFMSPLYFLQGREKDVILQEVYRNIGQFSTDWAELFPMMVLGVLPLLVFYLAMQKYIIGGVISGSVKG